MSADHIELEYAKEFWSAANAVTAFAIVQMIAYLFSVGGSDSKIRDDVARGRAIVVIAILVATGFYGGTVWLLGVWQINLLPQSGIEPLICDLAVINWARLGVVILTGAFGLWITATVQPQRSP